MKLHIQTALFAAIVAIICVRTLSFAAFLPTLIKESTSSHPIHAGITTIDYNTKTKSLEISCKIFADDLEEALKRATGIQAFIGSAKEVRNLNTLIEHYLRAHLRFEADGIFLKHWVFIGKELEGEAVWCYVEIPNVAPPRRLLVENTVLMEIYDDQTNLVNAQIGSVRRSSLLRKNKSSEILEF